MKKCSKCGIEKELSEFSFRKDVNYYKNECKKCKSEYGKLYRKNNPTKIKDYVKLNKEKIKVRRHQYNKYNKKYIDEYNKKYHKNNRDSLRNKKLKKEYGITLEQYDQMFISQGRVCAICGNPESKINYINGNIVDLCVDHNHETGKVRQLLCTSCNLAVGNVREDPKIVHKLLEYLIKWKN